MKFGLKSFAEQVSDTVEIVDPWQQDMRLTIYRKGAKALRKRERKAQLRNPVVVRALNAAVKAQFSRRSGEDMQAILEREAESIELTAEQLADMFEARIEEAAGLIVDWKGAAFIDPETGEAVPCTEEAKRELFEVPHMVPADMPYGGQAMGDAIVQWVHESAEQTAADRQMYLAEVGKGSGDTPAGASAPGQTIPENAAQ